LEILIKRKMPPIKKIQFGMRGEIPADAAESRIIPFILSTYNKDRHGTVLNQDNWSLDNYRLNPVVAYQHTLSGGMCTDPNPDYVIGKSVSIGLIGAGIDRSLSASAEFEPADVNPMAEKIFRKVLFGSLSRTSVGFMEIGKGKFGEGEEAEGRNAETYYFEGQELLEWSVVNIPSNPQAGKRDLLKKMREEGYTALMYAYKELGGNFRISQIEQFRVCDILDLLDGKDIDLKENDPEKVRKLLAENSAQKEQIARLQSLLKKG
jgi:hypothetical protein